MADHNNCVFKLYLVLLSSIEKPCNLRFIYTIFLASNLNISVIPREYNVRVQGILSWFAKQLYVNKHPIFVTYLKNPNNLLQVTITQLQTLFTSLKLHQECIYNFFFRYKGSISSAINMNEVDLSKEST